MISIPSIVRSEIRDFIHNPIYPVQGYEFNQYENIRKIHLYMNSRFYGGNNTSTEEPLVDGIKSEDDERIFFNITVPRVKAVKRFFDIDVAEVRLDEIDPLSETALQLLNKDFDRFAEKVNLSKDFNDMALPLVRDGSLVLEVLKNRKPEVIPLQRYFVDPTVECSKDSRFNTIRYSLTPKQLREKVKDGWNADKIEALIERAGAGSAAAKAYEEDNNLNQVHSSVVVDVYKRYGFLPESLVRPGGDEKKEVFALCVVGAGSDNFTKKNTRDQDKDEVLYCVVWNGDLPILDHHLVKTYGRWQGVGIVELLFPVQQRMNEVANQKRLSMELSALHLFQTADPTVLNNILNDLENGDVVRTKIQGSIQPIVNEERNLPAFESEIVTYQTHGDKLSFANDLLSGGDIASTTPATNVVVQNNNQVLVHLQDREDFTNFVANEYIKRWVVPQLIKDLDDEHYLRIMSEPEDLLQLDEKIVSIRFMQHVIEQAINKGKVVDVYMAEDVKNDLRNKLKRSGASRYAKVLKGYYKEKIGDIQVLIDNEKKDVAKIANNTLQFFNMIQNPAVLDDPVNRLFATNYAREIGIDTAQMELAFAKREAVMQQQQALPQGQARTPKAMPVEKEDPALAEVL